MNLNVLVVEDNPQLALGIRERLIGAGCRVHHATDGATAIRFAAEGHPDVVILDIGLPDMDGFEVCRQIRGHSGHQPKIIFFSAHTQAAFRRSVKEAGGDAFLPKTCGATGLLKEILLLSRGIAAAESKATQSGNDPRKPTANAQPIEI